MNDRYDTWEPVVGSSVTEERWRRGKRRPIPSISDLLFPEICFMYETYSNVRRAFETQPMLSVTVMIGYLTFQTRPVLRKQSNPASTGLDQCK
ncbi:unnamed protein product [Penicillium roqueforti FM164]|uniref:Genomic scaffold, ProqFM164S01 n=1 Tax=Penicillium roqueforti (strain FM164) TaxID=1365484 RepID=W6QJ68_PENRF|nr:unnamed protein product [Penicillium roqueforti FM164]